MGIGKNVQNEKTEPKQGKSLFWVTRRRTVVRQAAMFFYSKKKIFIKKLLIKAPPAGVGLR